ncbi:hypothetical protein DFJ73DRAFT_967558 [Zopfochytrium polystomum]|nr:hypothetical protein DFJ73DRAFT_967558 [Zopfochytrium polystomum]
MAGWPKSAAAAATNADTRAFLVWLHHPPTTATTITIMPSASASTAPRAITHTRIRFHILHVNSRICTIFAPVEHSPLAARAHPGTNPTPIPQRSRSFATNPTDHQKSTSKRRNVDSSESCCARGSSGSVADPRHSLLQHSNALPPSSTQPLQSAKRFNLGNDKVAVVNPLIPLIPCNVKPPVVDVPQYFQGTPSGRADANLPLWNACTAYANGSNSTSNSSTSSAFNVTATTLYNECAIPPPSDRTTYPGAPEFVLAYVLFGAEAGILLLHFLYKRLVERKYNRSDAKRPRTDPRDAGKSSPLLPKGSSLPSSSSSGKFPPAPRSSSLRDGDELDLEMEYFDYARSTYENGGKPIRDPNLTFKGYRRDPVGAGASATATLASIIWLLLLAILVLDYYAVFAQFGFREESDMIFYDHNLLSKVFILVWHFVTIWFIGLMILQDAADSYYGKRVPLSRASFVVVEKRAMEAVALANQGALVSWVRRTETAFRRWTGTDVALFTADVKTTSRGRRYIEFECVRYVYDDLYCTFLPFNFKVGPTFSDLHRQKVGLTEAESLERTELVGPNQIVFPADTFTSALKKEFSSIFYVYQMMVLWIWYYYAYYYMGMVLTKRVLSMANFTGTMLTLRDGHWIQLTTDQLVPGDVVEIRSSDRALPVDAVIVDGGAVCDESSLTGEALPVVKFAVRDDPATVLKPNSESSKANSLYAGCHVLEAQSSTRGKPVLAIVTATGAQTSKGKLVKDILFPSPVSFVFYEHLKVVFPLLIVWGFVVLGLSVIMLGASSVDSWFYGMMSISQVLSPLLPAVLVIGQSVASERLTKKGILCVDLDRITLSGKVKVYCFDKTGTLTKEGLNFLGVQPVAPMPDNAAPPTFGRVLQEFGGFPELMRRAMHTCHSVSTVGNKTVGNFVDVEMFKATGAALSALDDESGGGGGGSMVYPSTQGDRNLHVVKRFEFVHSNAYMTVLVRDPVENRLYVFLKGSFEKIRDICHPSSIPANYNDVARFHASEGCYVLGFACRKLPPTTTVEEASRWTREELERPGDKTTRMLGLCLFRNELKPDTAEALDDLRSGGCRVVMITGDNADTAVFIARKCGMIRGTEFGEPVVVMGELDQTGGGAARVEWRSAETPGVVLDERELEGMLDASRTGHGRPVELVVTGKAFNALLANGRMRPYLLDTRIFARMSPEDKVTCVRLHMERAVTAMCGDGGNDAGALKAAHSGIALSEAESSVVSHFSSRTRSVASCVELLREARCSLDVSFASYKYLIMYGEVLSFMGLAQYYFTVNMSQAMWILIDGTTVPLSWALTLARPAARLARTRPTARLLGPETITSVVGQIVINSLFTVLAVSLLFRHRFPGGFLFCNEFDGRAADVRRWWELADNFEGSVTGLLGTFQIVHASFVYNIGSTYRAGWHRNYGFLLIYGAIVALLSFVTLADPNPLGCLFHVNCGTQPALRRLNADSGTRYATEFWGVPAVYHSYAGHNVMPWTFRWQLWGVAMANLVALSLFEGVAVLGWGRSLAKRVFPLKRLEYRT